MMRSIYVIPPDERPYGVPVASCRGQFFYTPTKKRRRKTDDQKPGKVRHYWVDPETGKWYDELIG